MFTRLVLSLAVVALLGGLAGAVVPASMPEECAGMADMNGPADPCKAMGPTCAKSAGCYVAPSLMPAVTVTGPMTVAPAPRMSQPELFTGSIPKPELFPPIDA